VQETERDPAPVAGNAIEGTFPAMSVPLVLNDTEVIMPEQ
jgi:hypothetical protein